MVETRSKHEEAAAEAERIGRLVSHVLAIHSGDSAAKETTLALLLEHLHWQRQAGIREGANVARTVAAATEAKGGNSAARTLRVLASALDGLAAKNEATHRTFGVTHG